MRNLLRLETWREPRLSDTERRRLASARAEALRDLAASVEHDPSPDLASTAGVPRAQTAKQLLTALATALAPACATLDVA